MIEVIDKINRSVPLAEIIAKTHNLPTVTSFLTVIEKTAAEFGRLIVTVTKECDAELAQYANNNPSVLAVIADDSDFLIFSGNWRYLSMKHLNMNTFVTLEYNKIILRQFLGLDDLQLRVLSTLGGNDIIHYDEVRHFHNQNCGNNAAYKFQWLADFIKAEMPFNLVDVIDWIAYEVLQNTSKNTKDRIHESLMQYKTVSCSRIN